MKIKKSVTSQKKERLAFAILLAVIVISASFLAKEALGKAGEAGSYSINLSPLVKKLKEARHYLGESAKGGSPSISPTTAVFPSPAILTPTPSPVPSFPPKKPVRRRRAPLPTNHPPFHQNVRTTPYPSPAPGQPGSKEWQEEFDRRWEEMSRLIDKKNQEVRQAQEEFCRQNPDLCN